jgi:hypothetical protein
LLIVILERCEEEAADLLNVNLILIVSAYISPLPGMHSVMFESIGNESCGMLEVEHWTTAPDIEALAVAMAVLDNLKLVTGPAISVTF